MPLKLPLLNVIMRNAFLFFVLTCLMLVLVKARPMLIEPVMWYSISVFGYIVCTSGFIYSELHNMPMFRLDRDQWGSVYISEYFMKQQRSQYAAEGYIASCIAVSVSFIFLMITRNERFPVFQNMSATTKRLALSASVIGAYFAVSLFLLCYKIKTPWYATGFLPPLGYRRGPLSNDQGTNI